MPFTIARPTVWFRQPTGVPRAVPLIVLGSLLVPVVLLIVVLLLTHSATSSASAIASALALFGASIFMAPGVGAIVAVIAANVLRRRRRAHAYRDFLAALGRANGWSEEPLEESYDPLYIPATSGFAGTRPRVLASTSGTRDGVTITAQFIQRRHARGIDEPGVRTTLVYRAQLSVLLPHTVVLARNAPGALSATVLDRVFDDDQRVSLEGDLDRFFVFYTHRRTVTDALALWDPLLLSRVHAVLATAGAPIAIETIGRDIYVSTQGQLAQAQTLSALHNALELLVTAAQRAGRARRFLQLPGDDKYPYLRSTQQPGVMLVGGAAVPWVAVTLGFSVVFALPRVFGMMGFTPGSFALSGGIIVLAVVVGWSATRLRSTFTRGTRRGY